MYRPVLHYTVRHCNAHHSTALCCLTPAVLLLTYRAVYVMKRNVFSEISRLHFSYLASWPVRVDLTLSLSLFLSLDFIACSIPPYFTVSTKRCNCVQESVLSFTFVGPKGFNSISCLDVDGAPGICMKDGKLKVRKGEPFGEYFDCMSINLVFI